LLLILLAHFLAFIAADSALAGKYFQVEELSPHYFCIQPLISGPLTTSLTGGSGSQELVTRQDQTRTMIYARVPPGATLLIRVGPHRLRLWITTPPNFEFREE
jgi:hypothetical protein